MLILVGVSISLLVGNNGIVKKAQDSAIAADLAVFLDYADTEYLGINLQKITQYEATTDVSTGEVAEKLTKNGYLIEAVNLKRISSIEFSDPSNETYKLVYGFTNQKIMLNDVTLHFVNAGEYTYYVLIRGKYYPFSVNSEQGRVILGEGISELPNGALSGTSDNNELNIVSLSGDDTKLKWSIADGESEEKKNVTIEFKDGIQNITGPSTETIKFMVGQEELSSLTTNINGSAIVAARSKDISQGSTSFEGGPRFEIGTQVTITPTAANGYILDKWQEEIENFDNIDIVSGERRNCSGFF